MITKLVKYTDFNGNQVEEKLYFHLSQPELTEMQVSTQGGFAAKLQSIVDSKDEIAIIDMFKTILVKSYGVKSEDGRRFIKNDKLREEFTSSEAYNTLFVELLTNEEAAKAFMTGILPPQPKAPNTI